MNFKNPIVLILFVLVAFQCTTKTSSSPSNELIGTWKLLYAAHIKKDTIIRNDPAGTSMIKIINGSHFAFMQHTVNKADTAGIFGAGGGAYTLEGNKYTEHLEYCNSREYEGNDFEFTIEIRGDTLIQTGIEKLEDMGIGAENLKLEERYIRM